MLSELSKLLEEDPAGSLRKVLAATLKAVMDGEVAELCGADYGERTAARKNTRNGYRPGRWRPVWVREGREGDVEELGAAHGGGAERRAVCRAQVGPGDILAYFGFPQTHWRPIRSTNPLERLNKALRRRVRVV